VTVWHYCPLCAALLARVVGERERDACTGCARATCR